MANHRKYLTAPRDSICLSEQAFNCRFSQAVETETQSILLGITKAHFDISVGGVGVVVFHSARIGIGSGMTHTNNSFHGLISDIMI